MNKHRSENLPDKLMLIRVKLNLTIPGLIAKLNLPKGLTEDNITKYETGLGEPPLLVLLAYAKLAGVCCDVLIDDTRKLPRRLPAKMKC
jgi:hypothetical protein